MPHATRFGRIMTSPWMLLLATVVAAALGRLWAGASILAHFGSIYLALIELAVLPIIVASLIAGVAGVARSTGIGRLVVRAIGIFAAAFVVMALVGAAAGELGSYGMPGGAASRSAAAGSAALRPAGESIGGRAAAAPGRALTPAAEGEVGTQALVARPAGHRPEGPVGLSLRGSGRAGVTFLLGIVPPNVFKAIGNGSLLEILLLSILFGAAIGLLRDRRADGVVALFDAISQAGQKIISWLMILLPLGIVLLLAAPIARLNLAELSGVLRFAAALAGAAILILAIDVALLRFRSHEPLPKVLRAILDPLAVAFATRSGYAALPVALSGLVRSLGFYERSTNLFFISGYLLVKLGNVVYLSTISFFAAAVAGVSLGPTHVGLLLAGSLLAGLVTVSGGIVTDIAVLSLLFAPLGLPFPREALYLLSAELVALPLRSVIGVITTMCANGLIVPKIDVLGRRKGGRRTRAQQVVEIADFVTRAREERRIVVGSLRLDQPPFYQQDADGAMRGVGIDVVQGVAAAIGVEVQWAKKTETPADLITKLTENEIDIALLPPGFERLYENELAYTAPYVETREAMLIDRKLFAEIHERGEDMRAAFRRFSGDVALVSTAMYAKISERMFPKCRGVEHRSLEELAELVIDGEVVAAFGTEIELKYALTKRPTGAERVVCIVYNNLEVALRLAIAPNRGDGIHLLNETISSRRVTASADEIVRRYASRG